MNFTYIYSGDEYQQLRYEMMLAIEEGGEVKLSP